MDSQEPVFAKTDQLSDPQIKDVYPHKVKNFNRTYETRLNCIIRFNMALY